MTKQVQINYVIPIIPGADTDRKQIKLNYAQAMSKALRAPLARLHDKAGAE